MATAQPLSPASISGPDGMQSPISPTMFAPPTGPHARGKQTQQHQHHSGPVPVHPVNPANPWLGAASNPFPQPNASQTIISPSQSGNIPHAFQPTHGGSHVRYDPTTSSFSIPSGGGYSPPPDDEFVPGRRGSLQALAGAMGIGSLRKRGNRSPVQMLRAAWMKKGSIAKIVASLLTLAFLIAIAVVLTRSAPSQQSSSTNKASEVDAVLKSLSSHGKSAGRETAKDAAVIDLRSRERIEEEELWAKAEEQLAKAVSSRAQTTKRADQQGTKFPERSSSGGVERDATPSKSKPTPTKEKVYHQQHHHHKGPTTSSSKPHTSGTVVGEAAHGHKTPLYKKLQLEASSILTDLQRQLKDTPTPSPRATDAKRKEASFLAKGIAEVERLKTKMREYRKQIKEKAKAAKAKQREKMGLSPDDEDNANTDATDVDDDDDGPLELVAGIGTHVPRDRKELLEDMEAFQAQIEKLAAQAHALEHDDSAHDSDPSTPATTMTKNELDVSDDGPLVLTASSQGGAKSIARQKAEAESKHDSEGYFDWFVSDWSSCSSSCGTGIQERDVVCQHTKSGERVDQSVCLEHERKPRTSRLCTIRPCAQGEEGQPQDEAGNVASSNSKDVDVLVSKSHDGETPAADVRQRNVAGTNKQWQGPTLSQYPPDYDGAAEFDGEVRSCASSRWGREFIERSWMSTAERQCAVASNPDEHASVELIRIPPHSLPHVTKGRNAAQVAQEQMTDSFYRIRHALFHPSAERYTNSNKKGSGNTGADYALSLDCTATSMLRARTHSDPATASFLSALRFLSPHSPPLIQPSDPNSASIFTRAFERMTDRDFESTTIFIHRNCEEPYSSAQCLGDLFAVYALAHTIKVEFSHLRIIFLDKGDESPFFPIWQKLAGTVLTRSMWHDWRVAPFDEDDVYMTDAIFILPTMVPTLWSLGEQLVRRPSPTNSDRVDAAALAIQRCAGLSPLHIGFNHLLADMQLGMGSAKGAQEESKERELAIKRHLRKNAGADKLEADASVAESSSQAHHHSATLLVVAQGGGGILASHSKSGGVSQNLHLRHSGRKLEDASVFVSTLRSTVAPKTHQATVKVQAFPLHADIMTQLNLLAHAQVLVASHHSFAFNLLPYLPRPQQLHLIDLIPPDRHQTGARDLIVEGEVREEVEQPLSVSQGLTPMTLHSLDNGKMPSFTPLQAQKHAIFSAAWLCEKLECASYQQVRAPAAENGESMWVDAAQIVKVVREVEPDLSGDDGNNDASSRSSAPQHDHGDLPSSHSHTHGNSDSDSHHGSHVQLEEYDADQDSESYVGGSRTRTIQPSKRKDDLDEMEELIKEQLTKRKGTMMGKGKEEQQNQQQQTEQHLTDKPSGSSTSYIPTRLSRSYQKRIKPRSAGGSVSNS